MLSADRVISPALWFATVAFTAIALAEARQHMSGARPITLRRMESVSNVEPPIAEKIKSATTRIVERDLFRLDRHPSNVAYQAELQGTRVPPAPPNIPHPRLILVGTIGGPPWVALLAGLPGHEGVSTLVHGGESFSGLKIGSIGRDSIVVQGSDTTWRLSVTSPWQ
jgi:hypothetical protein